VVIYITFLLESSPFHVYGQPIIMGSWSFKSWLLFSIMLQWYCDGLMTLIPMPLEMVKTVPGKHSPMKKARKSQTLKNH